MDDTTLIQQLVDIYLKDPDAGEALARDFGLWDSLYEAILHPLQLQVCREDVNRFIEYVFVDPETGESVEQQYFHEEWQALITDNQNVLIAAPRGHGKSCQVIGRVVWELGHNTNLRIKIVAASDDKAKEILGLIRDYISDSDRVHEVFPNLQIDTKRGDRTTDFFVIRTIKQRDASVEASGVLSAGAGGRADMLICDDVVDLKNAISNPAMREQVIRAVKETWFSLVAATGKTVWICTPYHVADATHDLKNTGVFTVWWVPAIKYTAQYDDAGDPILDAKTGQQVVIKSLLWPDKWSEERLNDRREKVGERVFARQYLLNAMSDEERTFPEASLEVSFDRTRAEIGEDIGDDWITFGGVDLAAALGRKNAWTVIWTLAKSPHDGKLYLKEMYRRRMSFPDTIRAIIAQYQKHKWVLCKVENNAYQAAVIQAIDDYYDTLRIPLEPFTTGGNKADEKVGLPGMAVAFGKGHFAIPAARFPLNPEDLSPIAILMNELRCHPGGEFSDTIMALWFAWSAALKGSGGFEDAWMEAVTGRNKKQGASEEEIKGRVRQLTQVADEEEPRKAA